MATPNSTIWSKDDTSDMISNMITKAQTHATSQTEALDLASPTFSEQENMLEQTLPRLNFDCSPCPPGSPCTACLPEPNLNLDEDWDEFAEDVYSTPSNLAEEDFLVDENRRLELVVKNLSEKLKLRDQQLAFLENDISTRDETIDWLRQKLKQKEERIQKLVKENTIPATMPSTCACGLNCQQIPPWHNSQKQEPKKAQQSQPKKRRYEAPTVRQEEPHIGSSVPDPIYGMPAMWSVPKHGATQTWSAPKPQTWSAPKTQTWSAPKPQTWSAPKHGATQTWSAPKHGATQTWSAPKHGATQTRIPLGSSQFFKQFEVPENFNNLNPNLRQDEIDKLGELLGKSIFNML